MANTNPMGDNVDVDACYAVSFGNLKNKTVYQDYSTGLDSTNDMRSDFNDRINSNIKAHSSTTGGAGTAGYAMIPVYVDPKIIDQSRKRTPITELFPRVSNRGMYADYNVITAKGGAFTAAEDASLSETTTTYDRASKAIKFLYAVGRVTGPSQAAQPSYSLMGMNPSGAQMGGFADAAAPNAKQQEVLIKARELKELEENLLLNGNSTTSAISGNPDGSEFDGIITLVGVTNTVDKNTAAVALADVDTAIKNAFDDGGIPNLAVASSGVFTDILTLLNAKIGYLQPAVETAWGFSQIVLNTMVGKVNVIPSMFMSNASGSKSIYFLDMSVIEVRVLQDMTYEELAHTNDSQKFMLKMYETLIVRAPSFCSSITEISA